MQKIVRIQYGFGVVIVCVLDYRQVNSSFSYRQSIRRTKQLRWRETATTEGLNDVLVNHRSCFSSSLENDFFTCLSYFHLRYHREIFDETNRIKWFLSLFIHSTDLADHWGNERHWSLCDFIKVRRTEFFPLIQSICKDSSTSFFSVLREYLSISDQYKWLHHSFVVLAVALVIIFNGHILSLHMSLVNDERK